MNDDSICILICGVPRSGTSLTAGILYHLGLHMGEEFNPGDERINPTGFFENMRFARLHCGLPGSQTNISFFSNLLGISSELPPNQKTIYINVINEYKNRPKWGLKDARIFHCIELFLEYASQVWAIHVRRRPEAVIRSLINHPELRIDYPEAIRIYSDWIQLEAYALTCLRQYQSPVLEIWYEMLIKYPQQMVGQIAKFVQIPIKQGAIDFINPDLNRSG